MSRTVRVATPHGPWVDAIDHLRCDRRVSTAVRHYAGRMRDGDPAVDAIVRQLETLALHDAAPH